MISNRNVGNNTLGKQVGPRRYWITDDDAVAQFKSWEEIKEDQFSKLLKATASRFPLITDPALHEDQKHVTIYVHGYNNTWQDAAGRYDSIVKNLYNGRDGLGVCMFFTWPSNGAPQDYLPDRADAEASAGDLGDVLDHMYDWLLEKQEDAAESETKACRAKVSVIAHSMGNYVFEKAMQRVWTRKNRPLLVSLINQLLMVAADVDNDLFRGGEQTNGSDGDAIANLCYRVTALYTGRDSTLGLSAGLKHFGKRRLGRSGLDPNVAAPDNVWDVDCTSLFGPNQGNIHSAYFEEPKTLEMMRQLLRGVDRSVLQLTGVAPMDAAVPVTNIRGASPPIQ
jgi:esterase/lipase superfamily enzyme